MSAKDRFKGISGIYDIVNVLFSFGIDHFSRWYTSKKLKGVVCDLGAGKGELAYYLSKNKRVKKIYAIEISKEMLRKRIKNGKITYILSDARNLCFKDNKFDYIVSAYLFRNIEDKEGFFRESRRVLKNRGHIFLLDMVRPCFPFSLLFIPYIYLFTKLLSFSFPEYEFLRKSILGFDVRKFIKKYKVKRYKNIFGSIFYLFIL